LRLEEIYSGIRLDDVIVGGLISFDSSASTLVDLHKVFSGGAVYIRGYTSYNAIEIHNSRAIGGFDLSTLLPVQHHQLVDGPSIYDCIEISAVIADGGLTVKSSGDLRIAYSHAAAHSSFVTYSSLDSAVFDTNMFDASVFISLGPGNDSLTFNNSVVSGDITIVDAPRVQSIRGPLDGSSVMTLASNRFGAVLSGGESERMRFE
jgi:hypothetical protein